MDKYGRSALHVACEFTHGDFRIAIAHILLQQKGINVNIQDDDGNTPLHLAVERRMSKVVTMLLKNPLIDVDIKNKEDKPPGGMCGEFKAIEAKLSFVY